MFSKILIANRGEIAVRIARTAKSMGIQTVGVCSEADTRALHTSVCDESVMIGGASPSDSYLNGERIIDVARKMNVDAIHPGYGFLSENAEFAELCESEGIKFIGPTSRIIREMGLKSSAKVIVNKAGVPLLPGYHGEDQSDEVLCFEADRIGYPLLIKASAGGGGKGMRVVESSADFQVALAGARRESKKSFNNDHVLLERYIKAPRHVEVQIFADQHGNYVHLYERDCSLQRRYQKVIEEAPAPAITEQTRRKLGETAITVAQAVGYEGAGTVEFIMDEDFQFYFMEMNTRLQVEHPVTEMITGQDLVEWQLRVAFGEPLPQMQSDIKLEGHAFEARVYAENPAHDFLPVSGRIEFLNEVNDAALSDVRVDSGVRVGDEVGVYYDPMISKIICWGPDRRIALKKMELALVGYQLAGFQTNISFLKELITVPDFTEAEEHPDKLNTGLIGRYIERKVKNNSSSMQTIALFLAHELRKILDTVFDGGASVSDPHSPWQRVEGWRLNQDASRSFSLVCDDQSLQVTLRFADNKMQFVIDEKEYEIENYSFSDANIRLTVSGQVVQGSVYQGTIDVNVFWNGQTSALSRAKFDMDFEEESGKALIAPLPGHVRQMLVNVGDSVEKDQALVIVEAMKMEHTILSPKCGVVSEIFYSEGDQVLEGVELLSLEENS
ncbi:MAG: ATP-grasp domain-containing protein [Betaproteobacteria bacterium]|nr:ATP-grasp domain-containing protein [Betaproteobacteria bacterium]